LVRAGILSPELRDVALRKQARARLEALFAIADGHDAEVRFHVGIAASSIAPFPAPLIAREFLAGRARRRNAGSKPTPRPSPQARWETPTPPPVSGVYPVEKLRAMQLLGVDATADATAIRKAFRARAAKVHPDRHGAASEAEIARLHRELAALTAAYHLLSA
jgi:DnaJ-domain-containing protein 1